MRRPIGVAVCSLVILSSTALSVRAAGSPSPGVAVGRVRTSAPASAAHAPDALLRALESGRISRPTYALERARSLFDLAGVRARYGDVRRPGPRDATLDLRDLATVYDRLGPRERRVADGLLARPTDGASDPYGSGYSVAEATPYCGTHACFHWVTTTADAPALADGNVNGRPDYIDTVEATLDDVWDKEITTFGFRAPKSDAKSTNHGPDGKLDVYIADVGAQGIYGYCATDDPHFVGPSRYRYWDASAFCVLDNDYRAGQFPGVTPTEALQVTVAHEFFHASQFAYDVLEDRWLMEGTAAWIEDEVYDDIDDNLQYLSDSPITRPGTPLDSNNATYFVYGDWIFFRFLSEYFGTHVSHDVALIRRIWERADGARGGPDMYSLQAVAASTKAAGTPFRKTFAQFALVNDVSRVWYEEGTANDYPLAKLAEDPIRITRRRDTRSGSFTTKHLTNTYVEFLPGRGVSDSAHLVIRLDLPALKAGSAASAAVITTGGVASLLHAKLNKSGDGRLRVPFGRATIAGVDLVMTNASTRTRCWVDRKWRFSCMGDPTDDGVSSRYTATLDQ